MRKVTDMARTSAKGSFHVMWGLVGSALISAIGAIILARVLGEANYGLYAVVLSAPSLIGLFRDLGINLAITRYVAKANAENRSDEIKQFLVTGLVLKTLLGTFLSLLCIALAPYLAANLFQRPYIAPLIEAVSFTILAQGLLNTATAAFTGVEKMHLNSVMLVIQSIIRTALAPALVLLGLGLFGAVVGYTVSFLIGALIGILLVCVIYRNLPKGDRCNLLLRKKASAILKFGLPLSFSNILGGFLTQFYTFLLAIFVADNALIGNYNVAQNFMILITFFASPINTMLFPAFSKIDAEKEPSLLKNVYQTSVKYSALFVVPVVIMVIALATPAISILFNEKYALAPLYLSLLAVNQLFVVFGAASTINLINSQDQASVKLILTLVTVGLGIPLGLIMISQFGVLGLIFTIVLDGVPSIPIGLYFLKKRFNLTIDWLSSGKIFSASVIAGLIAYLFTLVISRFLPLNFFSNLVQLLAGVFFFILTFICIIAITHAISTKDIANFRDMASSLGPLNKIFTSLLNIIERLINALSRDSSSED